MELHELRQSWNRIAEPYQRQWNRRADVVQYGPYIPDESQLRLLGDVRGKRVLDLGCGGGQAAIALSLAGAECLGVDISDVQVEYARKLASEYAVSPEFHCSEMAEFLARQEVAIYDIVLSILAVPYVEDQKSLFRSIRRVVKSGGRFIFVTNHPLNDITRTEEGKTVVRRSYFDTGREEWVWEDRHTDVKATLVTYYRTLGETDGDLADAGFVVERLLEPEAIADNVILAEEEIDRFAVIPPNIIWKARAT
jgi:2-polyprenyl-3-methyl-5-hydroxy-6-metoxy-1,4-benzoquinol methylase